MHVCAHCPGTVLSKWEHLNWRDGSGRKGLAANMCRHEFDPLPSVEKARQCTLVITVLSRQRMEIPGLRVEPA